MRPDLQLANGARVVRGVARHRERQGGRAGCPWPRFVLHVASYKQKKNQKEEGQSNLPQIDRLPRKLVHSLGEHRVHR
jgi:hypothetical protein